MVYIKVFTVHGIEEVFLWRGISVIFFSVCASISCSGVWSIFFYYSQNYDIRRTKSQNVNVSRNVLQLSLPNLLKPSSLNSADRRCSNYIWVFNNFIAAYITGLTVDSIGTSTHWGLVTPYGAMELGQHWFRQWLVAWRHQAIRQRGKITTGSALDGAVLDFTQILAYLVHNMSRYQLYLGFGHFGGLMVELYFICWNYSLSSGWHIIAT